MPYHHLRTGDPRAKTGHYRSTGIGSTRFSQKVKSFLKDRFVAGTQTGGTLAS